MGIELTITASNKVRPEQFRAKIRDAFHRFGQDFLIDLKTNRLRGNPINRRSGNLSQGFDAAFTEAANSMEERIFVVGPATAYARMQEYGGTITAKNGKYLTIPLKWNQTAAGSTRITAREAISAGGFFRTSKAGNLILFGKQVVGSQGIVPLFALKTSVSIPTDESKRMGARALFRAHGAVLKQSIIAAAQGVN